MPELGGVANRRAIRFTCGEASVYRNDQRKKRYELARERNGAVEAIVDKHGLPRGEQAPRPVSQSNRQR